jgi:protein-L-isoaspartate(D-aspartate) O-methyltransferase
LDGAGRPAIERVDAALSSVPRRYFLPRRERRRAGADRPILIGHGQTNSQPTTVRNMLVLLDVRDGDRVLDVGSGSGWTTALLARLTGPTGRVHGVELEPDLVEFGTRNLAEFHRSTDAAIGWASIQSAEPGILGLPSTAPYDRILVSAEAADLPAALVDQLALSGRLVMPVAGRLAVVERSSDGDVKERRVGYYAFVPLR